MHIALIGATGLVGGLTLTQLISDARVSQITVISRRSAGVQSDKVKEVISSSLTPEFLQNLNLTAEVFICALGTTIKKAKSKKAFRAIDFDLVLAFAKLAEKSQARGLLVVSALGANKNSMIFYNKTKGEMEEAVNQLTIPSIYMLHPSLIVGEREENRFGEKMAILTFNLLKNILPQRAVAKMGTPVESIVQTLVKNCFELNPGHHIIEDFQGGEV